MATDIATHIATDIATDIAGVIDVEGNKYFPEKEIYNPDTIITKMPTKHSTKKITKEGYEQEIILKIYREKINDKMIAFTEIDNFLHRTAIKYGEHKMTLSKHQTFDTIITALNAQTTKEPIIKQYWDKLQNVIEYEYTIPASNYLTIADADTEDISQVSSNQITNKRNNASSNTPKERFISLLGNRYSNKYTYKKLGNKFVPIHIPDNRIRGPYELLTRGETLFSPMKYKIAKEMITITYNTEIDICGLTIQPEKHKYTYLHTDTIYCGDTCDKINKHYIHILENDPGYIIKFNLYYRSTNTDGLWQKLGVFAGSNSSFDIVRVNFDEIRVKELRIEPINFYNSYKNAFIYSICKMETTYSKAEDVFVKYSILIPRDGKYVKTYDKRYEGLIPNSVGCLCCDGRQPNRKGEKKAHYKLMKELCNEY